MLTFLAYYVHCYDKLIPTQMIPCYCDNSRVITNLTSMKNNAIRQPNDTTNDDYDIYATITAMAATCSPLQINYIHIKGHQDKSKERPLMMAGLHNVECN